MAAPRQIRSEVGWQGDLFFLIQAGCDDVMLHHNQAEQGRTRVTSVTSPSEARFYVITFQSLEFYRWQFTQLY